MNYLTVSKYRSLVLVTEDVYVDLLGIRIYKHIKPIYMLEEFKNV